MIERMPWRPLIAVFDEPTDKLSVTSPARLYPEADRAGIGIASERLPLRRSRILPIVPPLRKVPAAAGQRILDRRLPDGLAVLQL